MYKLSNIIALIAATSISCSAFAQPGPAPSSGATGANPTGTIGTSAVNGSAATFLRSDGAPAIPQASTSTFGAVKCDGTTITCTSGVIASVSSGGVPTTPFFGDGSDGNVTISGALTLLSNKNYNNLTISTGAVINPNGFIIRVAGTLDITASPAGWLIRGGGVGGNASGPSAGTGGSAPGSTGANPPLSFGTAGFAGITGTTAAGTNGSNGGSNRFLGGVYGSAGDGGSGDAGSGGTGGGLSPTAPIQDGSEFVIAPNVFYNNASQFILPVITLSTALGGGGSGNGIAGSGGGSGGGGAGGAGIALFANIISRGGSTTAAGISAKGKNGGNGGNGGAANSGGGGGSGGGPGGFVYIVYGSLTGSTATNLIDVTGGNGGTGGNGSGTGTGGNGASSGAGGRVFVGNLTAGTSVLNDANPTPVTGSAASGSTGGAGGTATTTQVSLLRNSEIMSSSYAEIPRKFSGEIN